MEYNNIFCVRQIKYKQKFCLCIVTAPFTMRYQLNCETKGILNWIIDRIVKAPLQNRTKLYFFGICFEACLNLSIWLSFSLHLCGFFSTIFICWLNEVYLLNFCLVLINSIPIQIYNIQVEILQACCKHNLHSHSNWLCFLAFFFILVSWWRLINFRMA